MTSPSRRRMGFRLSPLHRRKEPSAMHYMTQRTTFWVAVLSVFAFVTGNMMGQHGWHVFWKSVLGGFDDSLIVYTGVVPPLAQVPDYERWARYGGNPSLHTFREVPSDARAALPLPPRFFPESARSSREYVLAQSLYSVHYGGGYATGEEEGSHFAYDIRVPPETPVVAIMNGVVVRVDEDSGGFGKFIVLLHRAPDPAEPEKLIRLYSNYAHLSSVLVTKGMVVRKGEQIGATGRSGNASGYHLHFGLDRETCTDGTAVRSHPFWAFTYADLKEAGMTFTEAINRGLKREEGLRCTLDSMRYIQANYQSPATPVGSGVTHPSRLRTREDRLQARLEKWRLTARPTVIAQALSSSSAPAPAEQGALIAYAGTQEGIPSPAPPNPSPDPQTVASILIRHDGSFSTRSEKVKIVLLDAQGNPVESPVITRDLRVSAAYGEAIFRPSILTAFDFKHGEAEVRMLPLAEKTIVIQVTEQGQAEGTLSKPMRYEGGDGRLLTLPR